MISIVIPVYRNKEKLYKLLESIRAYNRGNIAEEVIVVDDFSPEDFTSQLKRDFEFLEVARLTKKLGSAYARNKGVELASGDIILFLDSDVILKEDTLLKIKKAFENEDVVAIDGEYDAVPANPGFFPRYKALMCRSFEKNQKYITILDPSICAIKKWLFLELGGFDTSYDTASVEDYPLSHKLLDRGYKIHYDKTIEVKHHFPESLIKIIKSYFIRVKLWAGLFAKRRKFDNFGTTLSEGLGNIGGFLLIISLISIIISRYFITVTIFLFFAYLFLNRRFFSLAFKEEGLFFLFGVIASHLIISFFITTGFVYGLLTSKRRESNQGEG